jgi:hypothetical protein
MTGGCLCGGVRFEIDAPLGKATYCHCTRCQRRTGTAASAQAKVESGSLTILQGQELIRNWTPEDGMAKDFCGECGAHLWSRDPDTDEIFSVRLGAVDGDPGVRPVLRQHLDSAAPWEPIPDDGLERHGGSAWTSGATGTM